MLHKTSYEIIQSSNPQTLKNKPICKEIRELKRIITFVQICEIEKILENERLEGRGLTWSQIGFEI